MWIERDGASAGHREPPHVAVAIAGLKWQNRDMAEHIEDLQHRYAELEKRIGLVRSYL